MNWYKAVFNVESDKKIADKDISHTIIVLNDAISGSGHIGSSDYLMHYVSHLVPEGWKKSPHYLIIKNGSFDNREDIGKEVVLTATHFGINGEVLAVSVEPTIDECQSCDIVPVNMVVAFNAMAKEKNMPEKWTKLTETINDNGDEMSSFALIGYIGELTADGKVVFED